MYGDNTPEVMSYMLYEHTAAGCLIQRNLLPHCVTNRKASSPPPSNGPCNLISLLLLLLPIPSKETEGTYTLGSLSRKGIGALL